MSKKSLKHVIPIMLAFIATFSLSINVIFSRQTSFKQMLIEELNGVGFDKTVILIALIFMFVKTWNIFVRSSRWITHLLAFVFSCFMLIGLSYSKLGNWDFIFGNKRQFVIAVMVGIGYFILFDVCLTLIYSFFSSRLKNWDISSVSFPIFVEKHYQLVCFLVISLFWLPYLLFHLPGSVPYDGYRQINMFYGIEHISNHHPWVLTKFFGFLMKIGRNISDNFGVFLIIIVLFLAEAFCYSIVCKKIKNWGSPYWVNFGTVLFFSILPVFGAYAQVVMKDGIFSALFALFFACYIELCLLHTRHIVKKGSYLKEYTILFIIEVLVCLTRNNGIYMVLPANLLLIFFVKRKKKYIAVLVLALVLSFYFVDARLAETFDVDHGSKKEMLSIPFQQTARYLKEYPDDVETWEKDAINAVLSYDELADNYEPEQSDRVKDTFKNNASDRELFTYFKAWFSMFLRHPNVYFEATFNNTYGYIYPFYSFEKLGAFQFYIKGAPLATGEFDIHYIIPDNIREICDSYVELWQKIPGLSLTLQEGTYTWLLLIIIGYFCYTKCFKGILALAAPFLNILVCIASPVNGYLRYAIPLIACTPIIFYWCFAFAKCQSKKLSEDSEKFVEKKE